MSATPEVSYLASENKKIEAGNGITFVYRELGRSELPLVLLQHFRGNLENWDPALSATDSSCAFPLRSSLQAIAAALHGLAFEHAADSRALPDEVFAGFVTAVLGCAIAAPAA